MEDERNRNRREARVRWATLEAESTRAEQVAAKDRPISEGLREAVQLWALTVAELGRRCENQDQLIELMQEDPPVDLTAIWRQRQSE